MDTYFKKAVLFADSHFGRSVDSPIANQDNLDFLDWMIDRSRSWGAETCIFLGDYFHNRSSLGISSLDAALDGLERLSQAGFAKLVFIMGNHDIARRKSRQVSSLNFIPHIRNIDLVRDPLTVGDVTFLPWLIDDERLMLPSLKSRYVFGHLETVGAMMNARVQCTGSHAIESDTFKSQDYAFSGHFHQRQTLKNICYIGNIMPFDFSDANDADRGLTLLEWGHDPIFEAWSEQPLYHVANLSSILDNLDVLRPKMTVRANIDIALRYEESQEIRTMLVDGYGLRKIEMGNAGPVEAVQADITPSLHTVDQIVIDGLRGIESAELSNERLIKIFSDLPRR